MNPLPTEYTSHMPPEAPPPPYDVATDQNINVQRDSHYIVSRNSAYNTIPIEMDCPFCQVHIVSHINKVAGVLPWLICSLCAFIGVFLFILPWCFCCLPFFFDQCLDVVHSCPACKKSLGRFSRI